MKKIVQWLNTHIWPWSRISHLTNELNIAASQIDALMARDSTHHWQWMATANEFWGATQFSYSETTYLNVLYRKGYGWREALDHLAIAKQQCPASGFKYDKIERPR